MPKVHHGQQTNWAGADYGGLPSDLEAGARYAAQCDCNRLDPRPFEKRDFVGKAAQFAGRNAHIRCHAAVAYDACGATDVRSAAQVGKTVAALGTYTAHVAFWMHGGAVTSTPALNARTD